jgi:hypothetical protein
MEKATRGVCMFLALAGLLDRLVADCTIIFLMYYYPR